MNKWISVNQIAPQCPCIGLDVFNQVFVLNGIVGLTVAGNERFFDSACWDWGRMDFREIDMWGDKVKTVREIKCWMPFPEVPHDKQ